MQDFQDYVSRSMTVSLESEQDFQDYARFPGLRFTFDDSFFGIR